MLIKTYPCPQNSNGDSGQPITESLKYQSGIMGSTGWGDYHLCLLALEIISPKGKALEMSL